ncbi:hypothetical protein KC19_7G162900 [Ceratodon purpureus]|uniref:Uncharacterized protein n=1 Tax=Ceratodon purpureus TaxID=3225 RepID=A0A8T0H9A5_CERPU|nr:hypothetical protein KC19_7G162900 [Ceratodon purpureus]
MAGGEGRNMGTKRKASEAAEGKGVVTSKVDQPVMTDRLEEMTELCDLQVVGGQQLMPPHCEAERLVCDEIAEDTDEDSDLDDFDAITGVLQMEIPARWKSGEITDVEAIKFHIELANLWRSREIADEEVFEYYTELANWRSGEITNEEFGEITDEEFFAYYEEMINLMSNDDDHESSSI